MTYQEALAYLDGLAKFGIKPGLQRIERLLDELGRPERQYRTLHVAGTNGKGSTAAMLAAVLQAAGWRTALYTSPHLVSYTERMAVNGRPAAPVAFATAVEQAAAAAAAAGAKGVEQPTEFEVLTAAAFWHFAAAQAAYAVVEVGLGGLLDSTNVITPAVTVITNVTREHTDRLGRTIGEIARHKAGIIKPGVPVVTAAHGEALSVIARTAAAQGAPLYVLGRDFHVCQVTRCGWQQRVVLDTLRHGRQEFVINLLGRHQGENAALAVAAAEVLSPEAGLDWAAVQRGLAAARWPGRFQIVPGRPLLVVDGAHNPAGAAALRRTLDEVFPGEKIVFVLGVLRDKEVGLVARTIVTPRDACVVVLAPSPRAAATDAIAREITTAHVEECPDIAAALTRAQALAGPAGVVCACGSLYVAGAVLGLLKGPLYFTEGEL